MAFVRARTGAFRTDRSRIRRRVRLRRLRARRVFDFSFAERTMAKGGGGRQDTRRTESRLGERAHSRARGNRRRTLRSVGDSALHFGKATREEDSATWCLE